jgi:hypothetical protein
MFIREKNYDNFIAKVRIHIGLELGLEKEDEAFIEIKELPTVETMKMKSVYEEGEVALIEYFKSILPIAIIDHNLYESESVKMSSEAVANLIFEKTNLATKVIGEYIDKVFFTLAKKNGDK